ncbi:DUF6364 family protein [Flavihumibacter petaseus]|uniref:Uncharacterized protein n=1 Tax=Flavihumibacter petaseus NBRC 106054 TaxID=1220578 RepID=A0A0E9N0L7_9BACT|nr:DUF6364 family protein [Flavihumibacter petaseus]GAO43186.1 hypothetical protein FPE01S_02_02900 [Flavihumibacter petaseus NBRC 106054]
MRIFTEYAYLWELKVRLNITVDEVLLEAIKSYAAIKGVSVSELVENHFRTVARPSRRKNILQLVDKLERPDIAPKADLKDLFYQEQSEKYGF